ncbi:Sodium/hydrogen exchanger family-domain-containing protein, partial [Ochromonadaceae sp. CCMP2298]
MRYDRLFLAGDPAQSIVEGIDFRFKEVRGIVYALSQQTVKIHSPVTLKTNYRCHAGILNCASGVLDFLLTTFPHAANKLPRDQGLRRPTCVHPTEPLRGLCALSLVMGLTADDEITRVVGFGVFGMILGSLVEFLLKTFKIPIPYTVVVFYIGIILSLICTALKFHVGEFVTDSSVASDLILYGLLPTLLFSETMNINLLHFKQSFLQSVILAGPGGLMVACLLAVTAFWMLPFDWSWNYCFLFGAIMCATDPVSVVSLLKSSHASSSLSTIVAGESLMNDGSAMILYLLFYNLINGQVYTAGSFVAFVAEMLLLSPFIGIVTGVLGHAVMKRIARPTNIHIDVQIAITFVCAYASYFVAGSVFVVSPQIVQHHKMQEAWELMEWVCNTLIFLLGGFIGAEHTSANCTPANAALLVVMFVFVTLTRALMVAALFPAVSSIGMLLSRQEAAFVVYAGLRGALALALALDAARNAESRGDKDTGGQLFFIVTGVVSMTLLLNGSTAGRLLLWLRLVDDPSQPPSLQKQMVLIRIKRHMKARVQTELEGMADELGDYNREEVARLCQLQHSEYGDFTWKAAIDDFRNSISVAGGSVRNSVVGGSSGGGGDSSAHGSSDSRVLSIDRAGVDSDLLAFTRTAFLQVVRARYMQSIHTGKIGSVMAAKMLLFSVDVAMDHIHTALADWDCIERSLTVPGWILGVFSSCDDCAWALCRRRAGCVSWLDAYYERVGVYVLVNYIEAHEYALSRLHFIMGMSVASPGQYGDGGGGGA